VPGLVAAERWRGRQELVGWLTRDQISQLPSLTNSQISTPDADVWLNDRHPKTVGTERKAVV
jgi:hypothetical protein